MKVQLRIPKSLQEEFKVDFLQLNRVFRPVLYTELRFLKVIIWVNLTQHVNMLKWRDH